MRMSVHDISIKTRIRRNLGDIGALMESMKKFGLLNPIVINSSKELIAGHRRLESARRLGWTSIEVVVLEKESEIDKLELEIEENVQRKSLTPDELADAYERLERLRTPRRMTRILDWFRAFFQRIFHRNRES
ncbi:MAG: ParB N-terminal domain-containing protein [Spirochaetales bacterium]|jgi:ParB family transcriptional regulator, chromosome partitioning protein|nr:ParB N-terminal domain-containing protein [Spirochaetales bacterium]